MRNGMMCAGGLLAAAATMGCSGKTEVAPRDLEQIMLDMYAHYDDPAALALDIAELEPFLEGEGRTERATEGYTVVDLSDAQTAGVDHPDRDYATLVGAIVGGMSSFPPIDHGVSALEPDQIWNDPKTLEKYVRTVLSGDADLFADGEGRVNTTNDIEKSGAFSVSIPYILLKDYQWVPSSDGSDVLVARSWVEERGCSENGSNCVEASFSLEVFYPDAPTDGSVRVTVSWIDLVTQADSLLTEEARLDLLVNGQADIFAAMDAHLAGTAE